MVAELFRTMEVPGVGMDNQGAVLNAAARTRICAVTLEKNIQWLLPERFGREMEGSLFVTINEG